MDVSIIIINYNTMQMTSECIDSVIANTTGIKYEIVLVDNASTDGSKEFFENDNRVKYIYSDINRGFGGGNNLGVKYAEGKYVFLLNSDTLLRNNAIKMLFDFSESQSQVCVCGGWLLNRKGEPNISKIAFPRMNIFEFIKSRFYKESKIDYTKNQEVDVVCGADMFLPKREFGRVGGFDEGIFMYGDEIELQYRLKLIGVPRIVISGPEIIHFGGGSASGYSPNLFRSHFFFLKKHMSKFNYCCARTYYAVNLILRKVAGESAINIKDAFMKV